MTKGLFQIGLAGNIDGPTGRYGLLGVIILFMGFRALGYRDDKTDDHDQAQNQPRFEGFRSGVENIVTHGSVDYQGYRHEAQEDGEFFQEFIPLWRRF